MKNTLSISILLLILISSTTSIQAQTYYKRSTSNRVYTKMAFNNLKKKIREQLKEKSGEITINEILIDSITSNDSIIKTIKLDIRTKRIKSGIKRPTEKVYSYLNKKFPNKALFDIKGNEIRLENLKGKPVVINFWFTRCKPCVEEIPVLNKLVKKYSDEVHFVSITFDNKEIVSEFLKKQKFDYLHIINARKFTNEIGISGYPKNIFIDKNGIVRKIKYGIPYFKKDGKTERGNGDQFESYIKELL